MHSFHSFVLCFHSFVLYFRAQGTYDDPDGDSGKGWPPHRDRGEDAAAAAFKQDGMPDYCTTWISLTDATVTNSCLYVVPSKHDPGYHAGKANITYNNTI